MRLDKHLASLHPDFSRVEIQAAIRNGQVLVNGKIVLPKYALKAPDILEVHLNKPALVVDQGEDIPLRIVYEDEALLVINKPPGLTVHPGAGQKMGTLMNALLYHAPGLSVLPRAGIVHRLDKDTAGLMVVAKTGEARLHLIEALKRHEVERRYVALVQGHFPHSKTVNLPIGRHPTRRTKMAVLEHSSQAKLAITHVKILKRFSTLTLIEAQLETGRTHQIRVHLAHLGFPLLGDSLYGRVNMKFPFHRQALQAEALSFIHPLTQEKMMFTIAWEADFQNLIKAVEATQCEN